MEDSWSLSFPKGISAKWNADSIIIVTPWAPPQVTSVPTKSQNNISVVDGLFDKFILFFNKAKNDRYENFIRLPVSEKHGRISYFINVQVVLSSIHEGTFVTPINQPLFCLSIFLHYECCYWFFFRIVYASLIFVKIRKKSITIRIFNLVWFGYVLWHINPCGLFNSKYKFH